MRRIIAIIMVVLIAMTFSSCLGISFRRELDENLHNKVEYVPNNSDSIIYQDAIYHKEKMFFLNVSNWEYEPLDGDINISWNGSRHFFYISMFYSYSADSPLYIYQPQFQYLYLKEDYDYLSDTFVIENSGIEVVFSDMFYDISEYSRYDTTSQAPKIILYSKNHPRIKICFQMVCVDGNWYMHPEKSFEIWKASDSFIKLLEENGLI